MSMATLTGRFNHREWSAARRRAGAAAYFRIEGLAFSPILSGSQEDDLNAKPGPRRARTPVLHFLTLLLLPGISRGARDKAGKPPPDPTPVFGSCQARLTRSDDAELPRSIAPPASSLLPSCRGWSAPASQCGCRSASWAG